MFFYRGGLQSYDDYGTAADDDDDDDSRTICIYILAKYNIIYVKVVDLGICTAGSSRYYITADVECKIFWHMLSIKKNTNAIVKWFKF